MNALITLFIVLSPVFLIVECIGVLANYSNMFIFAFLMGGILSAATALILIKIQYKQVMKRINKQ